MFKIYSFKLIKLINKCTHKFDSKCISVKLRDFKFYSPISILKRKNSFIYLRFSSAAKKNKKIREKNIVKSVASLKIKMRKTETHILQQLNQISKENDFIDERSFTKPCLGLAFYDFVIFVWKWMQCFWISAPSLYWLNRIMHVFWIKYCIMNTYTLLLYIYENNFYYT